LSLNKDESQDRGFFKLCPWLINFYRLFKQPAYNFGFYLMYVDTQSFELNKHLVNGTINMLVIEEGVVNEKQFFGHGSLTMLSFLFEQ